jgi:hypothetical protein
VTPRLRDALDRIVFARGYTAWLLDTIDPADWYRMPADGVTHVAWQVGHLAFAQYRLCLQRVRGPRPDDDQLIPPAVLKAFGRDAVPDPDPSKCPPPAEIRAAFDRVHQRVLADLADFPDADLDSPIDPPHRIAKTKLDCLHWCAAHELVHTGQIALLRRLFGQRPLW